MARNREATEREKAREEVAQRLLRGETQRAIAEALGVSQPQVSYDRKKLITAWRKDAQIAFDEAVGIELAKINHVEAEAWKAYFRSCTNRTITTDEDLPESSAKSRPKRADPFATAKAMDALHDEDLYEDDDDVPDFLKSPGTQIWISRKSTRVEQRDGNPRWLTVVMQCIERRCKLLGLDAPVRMEFAVKRYAEKFAKQLGMTPDEFMAECDRVAALAWGEA